MRGILFPLASSLIFAHSLPALFFARVSLGLFWVVGVVARVGVFGLFNCLFMSMVWTYFLGLIYNHFQAYFWDLFCSRVGPLGLFFLAYSTWMSWDLLLDLLW